MSIVVTEPTVNGLVTLKTSIGDISIELWGREAPKAVRNFVQLALEGFYDGQVFHRVVPGFLAQAGDPSGSGTGGESIYDEGFFEDEISQRLKFNRRGIVGMANQGSRNTNLSQFFITLDRADTLQNKHTVFGRIAGDTLFNVLAMNDLEMSPDNEERPLFPPVIKSITVAENPFPDMVPRITAAERKEQERAKREMKIERAKQREQGKRKGTKNKSLLSFGADPEESEAVDPKLLKAKIKSAHDVLEDASLSKEVLDDRGTQAEVPDWIKAMPSEPSGTSKEPVPAAKKAVKKQPEFELVREDKKEKKASTKLEDEIAAMQASLKSMSKRPGEDDDGPSAKKKAKKNDGAALLAQQRAAFLAGAAAPSAAKGKKKAGKDDDDLLDMLDGFRSKLVSAVPAVEEDEAADEDGDEALEDENDMGFLSHRLVFRKDATLDKHTADEYSVHDPLAKNQLSLQEMREQEEKQAGRRYANNGGDQRTWDQKRAAEQKKGAGGSGSGSGSRHDGGRAGAGRPRDDERGDRHRSNDKNRSDHDRKRREDHFERRPPAGSRPEVRQGSWRNDKPGPLD